MPDNWKGFFALEAPIYMNEPFVHATVAEVDFLFEALALHPGQAVLDVGCGTGRHAIELARRGIEVTGVDLSPDMLREAERAAQQAGVSVRWIEQNALAIRFAEQFDAAICLCEGAFCLLGDGDDVIDRDRTILTNILRALKPGGGLVLNALCGYQIVRRMDDADLHSGRLDPFGLVSREPIEIARDGESNKFALPERHYVPSELAMLLRWVGFEVLAIHGGTAGRWGRRPVDFQDIEIMAICRKPADRP
jgi:SAM-dependent methyltransferase